jgi:hypothetical protein
MHNNYFIGKLHRLTLLRGFCPFLLSIQYYLQISHKFQQNFVSSRVSYHQQILKSPPDMKFCVCRNRSNEIHAHLFSVLFRTLNKITTTISAPPQKKRIIIPKKYSQTSSEVKSMWGFLQVNFQNH